MGVGFFILLLVLAVVAILGGALYALTMWLRHKQLAPEEDKVEGVRDAGSREREPRPQHVRVDDEQRTRFAGTR